MNPLILDYCYYKKTILEKYKTNENQFNEKFFMKIVKLQLF
jgi:hypothetical protein